MRLLQIVNSNRNHEIKKVYVRVIHSYTLLPISNLFYIWEQSNLCFLPSFSKKLSEAKLKEEKSVTSHHVRMAIATPSPLNRKQSQKKYDEVFYGPSCFILAFD